MAEVETLAGADLDDLELDADLQMQSVPKEKLVQGEACCAAPTTAVDDIDYGTHVSGQPVMSSRSRFIDYFVVVDVEVGTPIADLLLLSLHRRTKS